MASILQLFAARFTFAGADFTLGTLFMIALMLFLALLLRHTAWRQHVYAVGDDPQAAELSGINVKATLVSGLYHRRADLRHGRLGADRAHRLRSRRIPGQQANIDPSPPW